MKKYILLCLFGILIADTGFAQGKGKGHQKHGHHKHHGRPGNPGHNKHYVKVRPNRPTYTRIVSPGRDYIYVEEDWTWNPNTGRWEWYGNRWIAPPQPRQVWVPGSWINVSMGWSWRPGHWR